MAGMRELQEHFPALRLTVLHLGSPAYGSESALPAGPLHHPNPINDNQLNANPHLWVSDLRKLQKRLSTSFLAMDLVVWICLYERTLRAALCSMVA